MADIESSIFVSKVFPKKMDDRMAKNRKMLVHVFAFLLCCGLSAAIGYASFLFEIAPQRVAFQAQTSSTIYLLENSLRLGLANKVRSLQLLGKMYQNYVHDRADKAFPEVTLPGYDAIASDLIALGTFKQLYWMPMVNTTTLPKFKNWAQKNIQSFSSNVTNTITFVNGTLNTLGGPFYRTANGTTIKDVIPIPTAIPRFNQWMFPILQNSFVNQRVDYFPQSYLFDPHSTFIGGRQSTIDRALTAKSCAISDILVSYQDVAAHKARPSSLFYMPVYSSAAKNNIIGLVGADTFWDTIVLNALPSNLERVDCVLSSQTSTWTISIDQGKVIVDGREGDYHDASMSSYGRSVSLDLTLGGTVSALDFTITVYPSESFYNQYVTAQPFFTAIAVGVVLFVVFVAVYIGSVYAQKQKDRIRDEAERLKQYRVEAKLAEVEAGEEALRVLLEAKKSYVRYISHELRTPLNAATLGLNMVVTQLKKKRRKTPEEKEMCETLSDIRLACSTAVDILNDLLSFEKLESGILVLHREDISVVKFMKEGIVMFSAQAKEKGVTLDLVSTIDEGTLKKFPCARLLRENDEFNCDRFKMDQVLRNLVSNAIKFSPEGGKVTLRVFFDDTPPAIENDPKKEMKKKAISDVPASDVAVSMWSKREASIDGSVTRRSKQDSSHYEVSEFEDGDDQENAGSMHDMDSFLMVSSLKINGEVRLGQLIIVVTDSGPGISAANQRKLFRGVIQFDPEKNQGGGGSGFGLFISKGIVDLHKGTIAVHSEGEGHGCSFILAMPMVRAIVDTTPVMMTVPDVDVAVSYSASARSLKSEDHSQNDRQKSVQRMNHRSIKIAADWDDTAMPLTSRRNATIDADLSRKKYRLLVVDDSQLSRKMLCKTMRVAGHECDEAGDGLIALTKVRDKLAMGDGSHMYDAVLMDTNMPNMDGPTSAKAMRDLGVTIPIFGVTGNAEENDIEHYKSQGATAVFVKPFDMSHFVRHMKEIEFSKT